MSLLIPILLSLILAVIHFWNEKIFLRKEAIKAKIMSFVAGASIAYVFLYLLPDFYKTINQWIFIFILLGFSLVYPLEKYFYQHVDSKVRLLRFKEIHFLALFLYYFMIGIILTDFLKLSILKGLLFFIPIAFYAVASRVSFTEVHIQIRERKFFRILLALVALSGVLSASIILEQTFLYHILLAFIIGVFFYIVIMDFFSRKAKENLGYFLLGICLYALLIILTLIF